jgi:bifunctional UDP-N-acetylglucosamine pyrophosphorylase/glucosamine-1-phosphate N-acetyltransferase
MSPSPLAVVVLAAGQGTRMKSATPKVLHPLAGVPLIGHVLATADALDPEQLVVVVRHEAERIREAVESHSDSAVCVDQDDVPGTGRAVEVALAEIPSDCEEVVVLSADVPLLDSDTLHAVLAYHRDSGAAVTILSSIADDPTGYGRIVRDESGQVTAIVEEADASDDVRALAEINSGTYVFSRSALAAALPELGTANAQAEKYLTDVIAHQVSAGGVVDAVVVEDAWLLEGINDRIQLSATQRRLNDMIIRGWQRDGVSIPDPQSVWIDLSVQLSKDVTILPGVQLHGVCVVGEGATIGPDSTLTDTDVAAGATVVRTVANDAEIHENAQVGPFAYLRPGTVILADGKVGTFVETKNSTIGRGAKVPHLSYIGDAEIGDGANIGAGTITANYDGVNKHRTVVGAHARTGSDNVFVAPVEIGQGAYTAAGTVVRRSVPAGALAVTAASVRNIDGWVEKNRPGTSSADAAASAATTENGK